MKEQGTLPARLLFVVDVTSILDTSIYVPRQEEGTAASNFGRDRIRICCPVQLSSSHRRILWAENRKAKAPSHPTWREQVN